MNFMKKLFSNALTGGNQGFLDENIDKLIDNKEEIEEKLKNSVIQVLEDEVDDLYRVFNDETDDWVWNAIKRKNQKIDELIEERNEIETSLELIKEDKVLFEEDKEVKYEVQPLQLED